MHDALDRPGQANSNMATAGPKSQGNGEMLQRVVLRGLLSALLAIVALAGVGLYAVTELADFYTDEVQLTDQQNEYLQTMRIVSRERTLMLYAIVTEPDPFIQDEYSLKFDIYGSRFAEARLALLDTPLNDAERALMADQANATRHARPAQEQVLEQALAGNNHEARKLLIERAMPGQEAVTAAIDELQLLLQDRKDAVASSAESLGRDSIIIMVVIAFFTMLGIVIMSRLTLNRTAVLLQQLSETRSELESANSELKQQKDALDHHAIVSIADRRGAITYINDRFCEISGYDREELLGQNHRIVKSDQHPPGFYKTLWRTIASGKVWQGEVCNRAKDGSLYWVDSTILPFLDAKGKPYQYVSIRTDITHMKAAEAELRRSNAILDVVSLAQSQFMRQEPKAVIFNSLLQSILDITGSEFGFIGEIRHADDGRPYIKAHGITNIAWNDETRRFYEQNAPTGLEFHGLDNLFGRVATHGELVITNDPANDPRSGGLPKGHPPLNSFMGVPFSLDDGPVGMLALANRAGGYDEELVSMLNPLLTACSGIIGSMRLEDERMAAEKALLSAKVAAEQANHAKSLFLANMSHELRTPMNGVVGMVDLMRETQMSADQQRMLGTVRDSAFGLLHILNDILDFSKIEAGKLSVEFIPTSLEQVLEGVSETLVPEAGRHGIRLRLYIDPALPANVQSDPLRLRQILYNLAGNAIKFADSEDGWVMLRAELVSSDNGAVNVRFRVIDNGIGMSEAVQQKLFRPFTQADDSTTRRYGGTGLGLSISHHLVQLLGGEITVQSEEGKGSEFTVTLPMQVEPGDATMANTELAGLRVWVRVDDEPMQQRLSGYLVAAGAQVRCLSTRDALPADEAVDVVVLDCSAGSAQVEADVRLCHDQHGVAPDHCVVLIPRAQQCAECESFGIVSLETLPLLPSRLRHTVAMAAKGVRTEDNHAAELSSGDAAALLTREEAEAAGTLVLVAEDNETNRDVLARQLTMLGYTAVMAEDGRQALEAWQSGRYGLVLTDCHMPEMDGFELTNAIREAEVDTGARVPIVAVTANALQGESINCLEAGMDDYLAKPVELVKLKRMLQKWLPLSRKEAEDSHQLPEAADSEEVHADTAQVAPLNLGKLTELVGDDPQVHAMLLEKFITESQRIVTEINQTREARDAAEVGALAHKIKSSARAMGAEQLAELAQQLEIFGKAGEWPDIERLEPQLQQAFSEVERFANEMQVGR